MNGRRRLSASNAANHGDLSADPILGARREDGMMLRHAPRKAASLIIYEKAGSSGHTWLPGAG